MIGNDYRAYVENDYNSLYHFGVKGQKWGVRRYQNSDGSLTPEGKMRYDKNDSAVTKRVKNDWNNLDDKQFFNKYTYETQKDSDGDNAVGHICKLLCGLWEAGQIFPEREQEGI